LTETCPICDLAGLGGVRSFDGNDYSSGISGMRLHATKGVTMYYGIGLGGLIVIVVVLLLLF
jgi:hypothetical protein